MSSVAVASFRWLNSLEKEFDKAFVDIDYLFEQILNETEGGEMTDESFNNFVYNSKEKLAGMSSCWAQLVHKAQTIFEINCKNEAQLIDLKLKMNEANAFRKTSEKEIEKIMIELHSSQLQLQKYKTNKANSSSSYTSYATSFLNYTPNSSSVSAPDEDMELIQKKLTDELQKRFSVENPDFSMGLLKEELDEYKSENLKLKEQNLNLTSEVYGARLASKYLAKELTGRIQQIQLFGKNLKPEQHELLWNQLETEIYLHRHKTVVKACRNKRNKSFDTFFEDQSQNGNYKHSISNPVSSTPSHLTKEDLEPLKNNKLIGEIRVVILKRNKPDEGLGISITGGREQGLPILISEIHEGGPAERCGLYIGDSILVVNDIDLKDALHSEAVEILSKLQGSIKFQVVFAALYEESDTESNEFPYLEADNDSSLRIDSQLKDNNMSSDQTKLSIESKD